MISLTPIDNQSRLLSNCPLKNRLYFQNIVEQNPNTRVTKIKD